MTDAADDPGADTSQGAPAGESAASTAASRLVELQRIDATADQLANRRDRLAERDALNAAASQISEWDRARASMRARLDELSLTIERSEHEAAELAKKKQRLEAQLKTVIAPREAEALMHEISMIDEQTDRLDIAELEALEEQSDIDDRLTAHFGLGQALRATHAAAEGALEAATSEIDLELATLGAERAPAREALTAGLLSEYDRIRASSGVAVARLSGASMRWVPSRSVRGRNRRRQSGSFLIGRSRALPSMRPHARPLRGRRVLLVHRYERHRDRARVS